MPDDELLGGPAAPVLPEWLVLVMWATVAFAAIWLVASIFVMMRRKASNLTPVSAAKVQKSDAPDFLNVDHKAREAAIKRGETFEKQLDAREAAEAAAAGKKEPVQTVSGFAKLASLLFSIFTLLGAAVSVIGTTQKIGETMSQADQIGAIFMKYPIPFVVSAAVIAFYVYSYVANKSWQGAKPRI